MGNGVFSCKGCDDFCCGRTHVEINNNLYGNYSDIKLDKNKPQQRIITNIFIPNCKLEFSPDNPKINQIENNKNNPHSLANYPLKKRKIHSEKCVTNYKNINDVDSKNNFTQFFKEAIQVDKNNLTYFNPSITLSTAFVGEKKNTMNNNNKVSFNNYNIEMLNFINKLRTTPKSVIEDIDYIIKNNLTMVESKECIISEQTREIIQVSIPLTRIKEVLNEQDAVGPLKLNNKLKIKSIEKNIEFSEKKMNELIVNKKKEIIKEYPECFFYPIFIKDIRINIIFLLGNNNIKEKIFHKGINEFYVSSFNERNNRFFAILCLA